MNFDEYLGPLMVSGEEDPLEQTFVILINLILMKIISTAKHGIIFSGIT